MGEWREAKTLVDEQPGGLSRERERRVDGIGNSWLAIPVELGRSALRRVDHWLIRTGLSCRRISVGQPRSLERRR